MVEGVCKAVGAALGAEDGADVGAAVGIWSGPGLMWMGSFV